MTLTEFLLARIAEDETAIRARWKGGDVTDDSYWGTPYQPSRLLVECDAKRSIIGLLSADARDTRNAIRRVWAAEILCTLALPYADHPDHLPEWKP